MGILRLLLALSVVVDHCGPIFGLNLISGELAVHSFYIISGFYMSIILNEKYVGSNSSYKLFITNRFIRLYPVYWIVLLLTLLGSLAFAFIAKGQHLSILDGFVSVKPNFWSFFYLILSNIILFGQDIVMFLGINPENGSLFFTSNFWNNSPPIYSFLIVPQAWTLAIELTFYLIAPFLLKRKTTTTWTIIFLSLSLRIFIYYHLGFQNDSWAYRFFPTEIAFFLFGHLSYKIYLRLRTSTISKAYPTSVLIFIVLFTILFQYLPFYRNSYSLFSYNEWAYFLSITLAIPILFNSFKKMEIDKTIGELSYPVYISHLLVSRVVSAFPVAALKSGGVVAIFSVVFSYLLNRFIGAPIEKYRQSRVTLAKANS